MELYQGHREWAHRRDDERFPNIEALIAYLEERYARSFERPDFMFPEIQGVTFIGDDPVIESGQGEVFRFASHAFRKLCSLLGAHAEMLAKLPAENAAADLQFLLQHRDAHILTIEDEEKRRKAQESWAKPRKLLALRVGDGHPLIRHIGSNRYGRIYDLDVARWGQEIMEAHGFTVPPSAYKENSGLYAGDESMFIMLQDLSKTIEVTRPNGRIEQLIRGIMLWNSEVGERKFGAIGFICQKICDNHIVWGAENVAKLETRHVGDAFDRAKETIMPGITAYLNRDTSLETDLMITAMNTRIAAKPDEALTFLRQRANLSKKVAQEALRRARYDADNEGLDPLSFMAVVNGLTSQARDKDNGLERSDLEQRARGLLQLVMPQS